MPEIPKEELKNIERMRNFETSRPGSWKKDELPQNWIEVEALAQLVKDPSISPLTKNRSFLEEVKRGIEEHKKKFGTEPRLLYSAENADISNKEKEDLHRAAKRMFNEEEQLLALAITHPSILSDSEYRDELDGVEDSLLEIADKISEQFMEKRKQEGKKLYRLIHEKLKNKFSNVSIKDDKLSIGFVDAAKVNYHLGRLEVNPDAVGVFGKLLDVDSLPTVEDEDMLAIPLGKGRVLGIGPTKNKDHKVVPFSKLYEALLK